MSSHSELISANSRDSDIGKKIVAGLGLTVAGAGFASLFLLPIVGIGLRKDAESEHAAKAHAEMVNAVLAITGTTQVDLSEQDGVLLQKFTDKDTIAVKTGIPNIPKARALVSAASIELRGTMMNSEASKKLGELSIEKTLNPHDLITAIPLIDNDIVNGDVITGKDNLIEGGVFVGMLLGLYAYDVATRVRD